MEEKTNKKINTKTIIIVSVIICLIIIDQLSKIFICNIKEISLLNSYIKISAGKTENQYSMLTYIVQNFIVLGIIIKFLISQNQFIETKVKAFLSLVLSGGIGNFIDRIIRGGIITIIHIKIGDINLNIAYLCIVIGMILLSANFAIFTVKEMRNKKSEKVRS